MKGQLVSHTFTVGFSVILLIAVIISLNYISVQYKDFMSSSEAEEICLTIRSSITKMMPKTKYNGSIYTSGIIHLNLPETIADEKYRISIDSDIIHLHLFGLEKDFSCTLNKPVQSSGTATGGLTRIKALVDANKINIELSNI